MPACEIRAENGATSARAIAGEKTVLRDAAFVHRAETAQLTMTWEERRIADDCKIASLSSELANMRSNALDALRDSTVA